MQSCVGDDRQTLEGMMNQLRKLDLGKAFSFSKNLVQVYVSWEEDHETVVRMTLPYSFEEDVMPVPRYTFAFKSIDPCVSDIYMAPEARANCSRLVLVNFVLNKFFMDERSSDPKTFREVIAFHSLFRRSRYSRLWGGVGGGGAKDGTQI